MNNKLGTPLCYSGNKTRLLPLIHENLPENYSTFVDVFGGSGVVGLSQDKPLIYNEKDTHIYNLIKTIQEVEYGNLLVNIDNEIEFNNLHKDNKNSYIRYRKEFNDLAYKFLNSDQDTARWSSNLMLLVLCFYSFNHQITFNSSGKFNVPAGTHRSSYNRSIEKKLIEFKDTIDNFTKNNNIKMHNMDYRDLYKRILKNTELNLDGYLFFIDPPYYVSDDTYSRTYGLKWTERDEDDLYDMLNNIDKHGGKFILTNQVQKGDTINDKLLCFSKCYNVINTNVDFSNSSYQRKNKGRDKEILVKNY